MLVRIFTCLALLIGSCAPALTQTQGIKPQFHGLLYMGDARFTMHEDMSPENSLEPINHVPPGVFSGIVVNVTWGQLQPSANVLDTSVIDKALAEIAQYNKEHPQTPLAAKLRIWPALHAPSWVKNLGGPPIELSHRGSTITIGRFWTATYHSAWLALQESLAQRYDANPLILEVTNTSCAPFDDEPFIVENDRRSVKTLKDSGYSDEAFKKCLMYSASDYTAWKTTSIDYPINGFSDIDSGKPNFDVNATLEIVSSFRKKLGDRGIISTHFLADPASNAARSHNRDILDIIRKVGKPIMFQTASPHAKWLEGDGLDWRATIDYGLQIGAQSFELWGGETGFGAKYGFTSIPVQWLEDWEARLKP